jgi:FtsP/CotA-like multicopper oxidase with cupredoxin domain
MYRPIDRTTQGAKAGLALTALVLAGLLAGLVALVGIDRLPGSGAASQPGVKTFELVAQEVAVELQPGTTVTAWTYNGTMPGPETWCGSR